MESPVEPKRARKLTAAQRAMVEGADMDTDKPVASVAEILQDLLMVTRPNNGQNSEEVCEAADHLLTLNSQTERMYKGYESKQLEIVKEKEVSYEVNCHIQLQVQLIKYTSR